METKELIDLGWMNSWKEDPALYLKCLSLGHRTSDIDMGPPKKGWEHVVKCLEGCGYVYRYDSSD